MGASAVGSPAARAIIAVDASSSTTTDATTLTWPHTVGSGIDRFLIVGVSIRNAGDTVLGITYGGVPLSFVGARNNHDNAVRMEIWRLASPPVGTGNVAVTLTGKRKMVGGAVSFFGVNPLAPLGPFASTSSTDSGTLNPSVTLPSATGEIVVDVVSLEGDAGTLTPNAGQTQRWSLFYGTAGGDPAGAGSTRAGAASVTMGWTKAANAKWAIGAVPLRPTPSPAQITLAKSADRTTAKPGDTIVYTLTYGNPGGASAANLLITDTVPGNTTLVPGSITAAGIEAGGVITWNLGTLPAGVVNRTVQFSVTVNAGTAAGTTIPNLGTATFTDGAGVPQSPVASNTASVSVEQVGGVTVAPDQTGFVKASTGKQIEYAFTVTNTGNGPDFYDLTIAKEGPQRWTSELLDASRNIVLATDTDADGTWDFVNPAYDSDSDGLPDTATLAAGASVDVILRLTVPRGTRPGHTDITSLVATSHVGPASDRATASSTAISLTSSADLTLNKTDAPDPVVSGDAITYAMTYRNGGNQDAADVVLRDRVPPDTTYVAGSAVGSGGAVIEFSANDGATWGPEPADPATVTDIRWTIGTLKKNRTGTAGFQVRTDIGLPGGAVIANTATLQGTGLMPVNATASTTVTAAVSLTDSTKSVSPTLAVPGEILTYTLHVRNGGVVSATGVVLSDTVPDQTAYIPGSITGTGAVDAGAPDLVWNVGTVGPGATVGPFTYQVVVDDPVAANTFSIVNVASVRSDQTAPVDTPTATTVLNAAPLFSGSSKDAFDLNGGALLAAETLEYHITVVNSGDMNATGVRVTDLVPAGTTYVPGTITGPGADDSLAPSLSWNVGGLAGGASTVLTFRVTIDAGVPLGTTISNVATVASDQTAPFDTPPSALTVGGGTTGFIQSTTPIAPGVTVTLTVTDSDLNTDIATAQSFSLVTTHTSTGEVEQRTYMETGPDTGIFEATVATVFGVVAGTNHDGTFNVQPGDALVTVYTDALTSGGGTGTSTATTFVIAGGTTGTLTSTTPIFPGDTVTLTLSDADLNTDSGSAQSLALTTTNTGTGESETRIYIETGPDTGVFAATVATTFGAGPGIDDDGIFEVEPGDALVTVYNDAATVTGGPGTATATTDVVAPANPFRPDAMIRLSTEGDPAYLADDVYEDPVATQIKQQGVPSGSTAVFSLRLQNDGNLNDGLRVTGPAGASGFSVVYLDETSTDRTAAVTGAGYVLGPLAPGAAVAWTLRVTPSGSPSPVPGGTPFAAVVTLTSDGNATLRDQVEARTSSTSANLTLVKSADRAAAAPGEEIAYTVVASNGAGLTAAGAIEVVEPLPSDVFFKLASTTFDPGTTPLTSAVTYSDDGGATWSYVPASAACSAPAGYDGCVTGVRWTMTGAMDAGQTFSVGLVARVR